MKFFEIPSLEQIEEMERQQSQAVEALEISISETGEPRNVKGKIRYCYIVY